MFQYLRRFFTDETAFIGMMRGIIMAAGGVVATGNVPVDPVWGAVLMGLSSTIRAGDKNTKEK